MAVLLLMYVSLFSSLMVLLFASNFSQDFVITWGNGKVKNFNHGEVATLYLDKDSGSGMQSKNEFVFGKIDMQIKLVSGNSAGTVTSYYLASQGLTWDEIDFEFLGNLSGDPYIFHTNVITQGKGDREQQFYPWFDPTTDFHTYSILWNPKTIMFHVDDIPIRVFKNLEKINVSYPKDQPMRIHSSLWNADDWATRGGRIKTDWTKAPFSASFRNLITKACVQYSGSVASLCPSNSSSEWLKLEQLDETGREKLKWVQKNYMVYNYCTDTKRFPKGFLPECASTNASQRN